MCNPGTLETWILKKKSDNVAMARASTTAEGLDVAQGQRLQPAPAPPQHSHRPCVNSLDGRLTRHKASG